MSEPCCSEYATLTRRGLLTGAAIAGTSTLFGSTVLTTSASAATPARSVLVVLSLRGAADGLSLVVPHGDPVYYAERPRIAIPADQLVARDGFFGLHPELRPLLPLWREGKLAAVHATGLPAPNRSHFSAMEEVEDADPGSTARVGWLNRLLGTDSASSALEGVGLGGGVVPASLQGPEPFLSAEDVDELQIAGMDKWDTEGRRLRSLHTLWDGSGSPLAPSMRTVFGVHRQLAPVRKVSSRPANGARYGSSELGQALKSAARIIRGDVGVQVLTVDHGGWDMHSDLGTTEHGRMQRLAQELGTCLAAFFTDLGSLADKVTVVALSEFGRRVQENGSRGLDHGYGNMMLLLGAGVQGGRYYARWPGLTRGVDSDLLVTTDYRSVLAEVVSKRFGVSTATVFPGFRPDPLDAMRAG